MDLSGEKVRDRSVHAEENGMCPAAPGERELNHMLMHTLNQLFLATVLVNLLDDTAVILQSMGGADRVSTGKLWAECLEQYGQQYIGKEVRLPFSSEKLLELYRAGEKNVSREMMCQLHGAAEWVTVDAYLYEENGTPYATVTVRKSSGDHLRNSIIDLYVYSTCDYFIYLDAKNNRYTSFSRRDDGTPLPPAICEDYATELVRYAQDYVVPEDREKVIFEMGLERVLERLELRPKHSFTCGILDPVRGYTRKRLTYQYYDRETQMILLSRTDITDVYLENQKKQSELQTARQQAKQDALTGLYNLQGVVEEITDNLRNRQETSALLFIDLDNFKMVNDTFGHSAGNDLLCSVAQVLRENVRSQDLVGRIGGDEFLVFFRNIKSVNKVRELAGRLHEAVYRLSDVYHIPISCSVGVAVAPDDGTDYTTLMKTADRRVYQAKRNGKNQYSMD